ncbi:hypothetical protein AB0F81_21590 [Actinoplanes sp. NPDC024001]|uniref:TetR/AcrR family transcriptional regulator n=1 Tax=Actinoplanes sp. NPDC024001 TaxID=3154598 RepID=UPI0033CCD539
MAETSADQLRQTVVWAAVPLLGEFTTVTMPQIAQAAGITEEALLTVFPDKDAVLLACTATLAAHLGVMLDPAEEVRKLDAIRLDQPLAARLTEVVDILDAYYHRVRADLDAFEQAGYPPSGPSPEPLAQPFQREDFQSLGDLPEIRTAVTRLLEPDLRRLRFPPDALAEAFLAVALSSARSSDEAPSALSTERVVDLFLHGATADDQPSPSRSGRPDR